MLFCFSLDYTRCGNESAQCITVVSLCDGLQDCVNGWDESAESCVPLTVRAHFTECNIFHTISITTERLIFQLLMNFLQMLDLELMLVAQDTEKYSSSRGTHIHTVDAGQAVATILTRRSLYLSRPPLLMPSKALLCTLKCLLLTRYFR